MGGLVQLGRRWRRPIQAIDQVAGDPSHRRPILILAGVLALQAADSGAVGALAPQLERAFRIGPARLGLLAAVTALVGAVGTLPMGVVVDRRNRVRLLTGAAALWAVAMAASGAAPNYLALLLSRLGLGVITAAAGPAISSLSGDLFPPRRRSRIYGLILTGELLGTGAGLLVAGDVGAATSWRVAFFLLAVPSAGLAWVLHRYLPEPARGGQGWLEHGAVPGTEEVDGQQRPTSVRQEVEARSDITADTELVIDRPAELGWWGAVRHVLRVRSNRVLIAASALGYFFLAGLRTFAVLFARGHYHISTSVTSSLLVVIGAGAVLGTIVGGRVTDRLIDRSHPTARPLVAGCGFVLAAVVFAPALAAQTLPLALPLLVLGAGLLSSPNPALDAARLDVMPAPLWGRAEAIRSWARGLLEAAAPLLFGLVAQELGGSNPGLGVSASSSGPSSAAGAMALQETFLIMLVPMLVGGALLLARRRAYLTDVATAAASASGGGPAG